MNRRNSIILVLGIALVASCTYAAMEDFIVTDPRIFWPEETNGIHFFRYRDFSLVPTGLYIQGLSVDPEYPHLVRSLPTDQPFPSNKFYGWYCYGNYATYPVRHDFPTNYIVTGRDNTHMGWPEVAGTAICNIQSGGDDWIAWMRVFSDTYVTNAAYYGDTDTRVTEGESDGAGMNYIWPGYDSFIISNVNPAYMSLHFDQLPNKVNPTQIVGSVNTSVNGGNNELENGMVSLRYSTDDGNTWLEFASLEIVGAGNFTGTMAGAVLATPMVKVTGLNGGLPDSNPMTVLPEPAFLAGAVALLTAWVRRAARA